MAGRGGAAPFQSPTFPMLRRLLERGSDESADKSAEERETADFVMLVMHDDRRGRRGWRRVVHDYMAGRRRRRRVVRHMMPCGMVGRGMMRRGRLLMHRGLVWRAVAVAAVRRGKGCSAKDSADETRDQEFHDVVVHITPLSTFCLVVSQEPVSRLH